VLAPLLLYGYGSCGMAMPASFSTNRPSLVEYGNLVRHERAGRQQDGNDNSDCCPRNPLSHWLFILAAVCT
jgi:hypothetical protein